MNVNFGSNIGRRLLALVLSVALVLAVLPAVPVAVAEDKVPANGAEDGALRLTDNADLKSISVVVPTFMKDWAPLEGDAQINSWADEQMPTYSADDMNGLCVIYKEQLLAHAAPFSVTVPFDVPLEVATNSDKTELTAMIIQFRDDVMSQTTEYSQRHTGVPNEGDYIKYQTGTRSYAISVGTSATVHDDMATLSITMKFNVEYFTTLEQEQAVTEKLGEVMPELELDGKSRYEKIKTIHDWIVNHNEYDHVHVGDETYRTQYTAYGALIDQTSVCQGYAVLFYRMCLEAGIDVRVMAGIATTSSESGRHSWNIVRIDGKYYYVDTTWDDPTVASTGQGVLRWDYFLIGSNKMSQDHDGDPEFKTDEFADAYLISETDYERSYYDDITDDKPSFVRQSLTLGGLLGMNVFMKLPEIDGCDYADSYLEFWFNDDEENAQADVFDPDDRSQDGRLYKFTVPVNSIQMADNINVQFHYFIDGAEYITGIDPFTVENYLKSLIDEPPVGTPWALIELAIAIKNYGFYAQQYLSEYAKTPWVIGEDHNAMDAAADFLYAEDLHKDQIEDYAPEIENREGDIEASSISLTLETDTAINIFVNIPSDYSDVVRAFDYQTGDDYEVVKVTAGRYKITIPGIAAHQLGQVFNPIIMIAGSYVQMRISVLSYVYLCIEDGKPARDVGRALYDYYRATQDYQDYLAYQG
jgi:hypothetical protein